MEFQNQNTTWEFFPERGLNLDDDTKNNRQERKQAQVRGKMAHMGNRGNPVSLCRENTCRIYYRIIPLKSLVLRITDTVDRGMVYIQWQWSTEEWQKPLLFGV